MRIEVRHLLMVGCNSGGCIGKFGSPADSSAQKIPGLHLSVACDLSSERAIGT